MKSDMCCTGEVAETEDTLLAVYTFTMPGLLSNALEASVICRCPDTLAYHGGDIDHPQTRVGCVAHERIPRLVSMRRRSCRFHGVLRSISMRGGVKIPVIAQT